MNEHNLTLAVIFVMCMAIGWAIIKLAGYSKDRACKNWWSPPQFKSRQPRQALSKDDRAWVHQLEQDGEMWQDLDGEAFVIRQGPQGKLYYYDRRGNYRGINLLADKL